jgi:hypothetical protein
MGDDLQNKLKMDIDSCCYFSLQFDDSTDVVDTSELIVFIRMVFHDMSYKEEFLTMIPMEGKTGIEDVYQQFVSFAKKTSLPLWKVVCIATDGAPVMVGKNNEFLALCQKKKILILQQSIVLYIRMHCVHDRYHGHYCSVPAKNLRRRLFRTHLE